MSEEYPVTKDDCQHNLNKWGRECFVTVYCSECGYPKSAIGAKFVQGEKFGRMVCRECQETT